MNKKYFNRVVTFGATMLAILLISTGCGSKTNLQEQKTPTEKQPTATITIKDYGEVKVMLYPDEAPKSVENFIALAEKGYYDGLKFHRVIDQFMIQGGDPKGDGTGGESKWGGSFQEKPSKNLHHISGALCFAQTASGDITSQFYIVNSKPLDEKVIAQMKQYGYEISDEMAKKYEELGGAPTLDGSYTVFGQVYEGLDVIKKVMETEVKVNATNEKSEPVKDVIIESIKITKK